jgi:RHS repeat-associated protein
MVGNRIQQSSMDAGERWILHDVGSSPIRSWDSREQQTRVSYDALRRPLETYLRRADEPELQIGRTVYGESLTNPEAQNLRGKVAQLFDQAGVVTSDAYDFKGNFLSSRRQLAQDYKTTLDWSASVPLESETFILRTHYDALNRPTEIVAPDNSVIRYRYNEAHLPERLDVNLQGAQVATPFISDIDYDARGERTVIALGNGVETAYRYDPLTFRLSNLVRRRGAHALQDLHYVYDPGGNITHIRDDAQQTLFFQNKRVEPSAEFTYDAIYRLTEATGREHLGQTNGQANPPDAPDAFNGFHSHLAHPGNGDAMGVYAERYTYDEVGNLLSVRHHGSDPSHPGWTREYAYSEPSLLEPGKLGNRLTQTTLGTQNGQPQVHPYDYDQHGNMRSMPHLSLMQWDYRDQLQATSKQVVSNGGTPESTYYVYDANGQRIRKVTERHAAAGQAPTRKAERIYLSGVEIYREYENDGDTVKLERETLHVMNDSERIALVETRTRGSDASPQQLIRYQLGNHLGSASLELDEQAQIITYEEYYPYGSTSYQSVRSQTETPKRYRFTGKERDDETGLSYHGARYYAPWLGRWTSCDPLGIAGGGNLYAYAHANPVRLIDPSGMQPERVVNVRIDESGTYHLPYEAGEVIEMSREAPPPDKLEIAIRNKLIHVLTLDEFEKKLRWEHKQGKSGYAGSWTQDEIHEHEWATDQERVAMSEAKWWAFVEKEYAGYRAGKAAEWDKSSRLMATHGKIGKGIGWGVVAVAALFGGAAVATPGSLLGGGTASSALAGGGATSAAGGGGLIASAQFTTGQAIQAATSSTAAYFGTSVAYGLVAPPGAPDLPGPGDEFGRTVRAAGKQGGKSLGERAEEFLPEAIKRVDAAKAKYGNSGIVMSSGHKPFEQWELDNINLLRKSGKTLEEAIEIALEYRKNPVTVVPGGGNAGGAYRDPYGIKRKK